MSPVTRWLMPKTGAERIREYRVRNRQRARAMGLCTNCFKEPVAANRAVCKACSHCASLRTIRRRATVRKNKEIREIVAAHEAAGDKAQSQKLFDTAAQHYRDALHVPEITPADQDRIRFKFNNNSFITNTPVLVEAHTMNVPARDIQHVENTLAALMQTQAQMWIASRTRETLPLFEEAVRLSEGQGSRSRYKHAIIRLANYFAVMGDFDTAADHLTKIGKIESTDSLSTRRSYHRVKGFIIAMRGSAEEAYYHFEKSLQYAKD